MSHSVCLMQRRDLFFGGGWRDPCNLPCVQLTQQFMKLDSFICLTCHLSENLKIRHKFSPTTYTNQKFWFLWFLVSLRSSKQNLCALFQLIILRFFRNQKGFYYRGFCWLCMRNSLADDVVFILMDLKRQNSIQTENIQLAHLELYI